jgi:hypothetical protein
VRSRRKFSRSGRARGQRDGHQELEDSVAVVGILLRIVVARPEDVVHLEHDEPELRVETRPVRPSRGVGGREGGNARDECAENLVFERR